MRWNLMDQEKLLSKVTETAKEQLNETTLNLVQEYENIINNQNEQILAIVTTYKAIEKIANHLKIKLDEPLINMNIENEDEVK